MWLKYIFPCRACPDVGTERDASHIPLAGLALAPGIEGKSRLTKAGPAGQ